MGSKGFALGRKGREKGKRYYLFFLLAIKGRELQTKLYYKILVNTVAFRHYQSHFTDD